ncbi:unnamed protein product [Merluccius merluccius]
MIKIGTSLNKGEKNHLKGRKPCVQQCLEKNNIPCTLGNVPNIAILGSGGGERAMVGMLGSLSKLAELGLLDAALYMSGVSGATWCMASVYEKPNWSSDIKQIKSVVERIGHGSVSLRDQISLLKKYHRTNANFSLTDVWTALVVPMVVKKIDESTLSNYQTGQDPYPIYTIIDQDCKYEGFIHESFFELTPHEAGYTLAGAFVETSSFGSIFNKGVLREKKPEMDMTYLQGVCGSALADKEVILKKLKEWLEIWAEELQSHDGPKILAQMLELNYCILRGEQWTQLVDELNALLTDFSAGDPMEVKSLNFKNTKMPSQIKADKMDKIKNLKQYFPILKSQHAKIAFPKCVTLSWIWGTNYNFLYDMNVPQVHQNLQESETSHFEDAGLLVNSPYMSALRAERGIDLIISLDFSAGDPMQTVTETAKLCKEFDIPFPAINVTKCDSTSPKAFYVFKGLKKAPTVIHMPLFNIENCGSELEHYREKYGTFQLPYKPEMIEDLMEKAGENIINNKENLLREIESIVKQK